MHLQLKLLGIASTVVVSAAMMPAVNDPGGINPTTQINWAALGCSGLNPYYNVYANTCDGGGSGNYVQLNKTSPQVVTGPVSTTYSEYTGGLPTSGAAGAASGYNADGFNEHDIYALTNGGTTDEAIAFKHPNGSGGFENIGDILNNGELDLKGNGNLLTAGTCWSGPITTSGLCDDGSGGGWAYTAASSSTYGHRWYVGSSLLYQMDILGNLKNAAGNIIVPTGASAYTGTGSPVYSSGPTLVNPVVGTQTVGNNSTLAASTAFVQAAITAISAGVTNVNGNGGALQLTGNVTCVFSSGTTTCTISSTGIANVNFSIPSGLAASGNTCYGYNGSAWVPRSGTNYGTFTMTGVSTSPQTAVAATFQGSPYLTTGWGATGGLVLNTFAVAPNTVGYDVCNQTGTLINSGTPTFIVSAH